MNHSQSYAYSPSLPTSLKIIKEPSELISMLMMSPSKAEQKYDQCWMIYHDIRTDWMSMQGLSCWLPAHHPPPTILPGIFTENPHTGGEDSKFYCRTSYNTMGYIIHLVFITPQPPHCQSQTSLPTHCFGLDWIESHPNWAARSPRRCHLMISSPDTTFNLQPLPLQKVILLTRS